MGLFVKWGSDTYLSEARCLYAIGRLIGDIETVPEVYGWHTDGDERFVHMEHVQEQTLEQYGTQWNPMNEAQSAANSQRA